MAAWYDTAEGLYDRQEAQRFEGDWYPSWRGPTSDAMARTTDAALAAVDSVIGLLPSVEGEPWAGQREPLASAGLGPSPSATPEGLTARSSRAQGLRRPDGLSPPAAADWPVHQPAAPLAPIPGRHWFASCDPDRPRVRPDGTCEGCGEHACPKCGREGCEECAT